MRFAIPISTLLLALASCTTEDDDELPPTPVADIVVALDAATYELPEGLFIATSTLLGVDARRAVQNALTRRLGSAGSIGQHQETGAEQDYARHHQRRRNPHLSQILHVELSGAINRIRCTA